MTTMKLDLSEWKNLAISHLRLMANQLDQAGLLNPDDLHRIDAHWGDVIRPRLDAWATESAIAMQEQQRVETSQPSHPLTDPTVIEKMANQLKSSTATSAPTLQPPSYANGPEPVKKRGGRPKGSVNKPKAVQPSPLPPVAQ